MSNTKRALEMLRELHIRGEHEWLDQEDIGTVIAALEADASPSASEPLPDMWHEKYPRDYWCRDEFGNEWINVCEADESAGWEPDHTMVRIVEEGRAYSIPNAILRALLGRSEPTRAEVERDTGEGCYTLEELCAAAAGARELVEREIADWARDIAMHANCGNDYAASAEWAKVERCVRSGEYRSKRGT